MTTTKIPESLDRDAVAAWVHSLWAVRGEPESEDYVVADAVINFIDTRLGMKDDPAYVAHMERAAAAGEPALPATDDEWKARLVEGGVA